MLKLIKHGVLKEEINLHKKVDNVFETRYSLVDTVSFS